MTELIKDISNSDIENYMVPIQNDLIAVFSQLELDIKNIIDSALKDEIPPDELINKIIRLI